MKSELGITEDVPFKVEVSPEHHRVGEIQGVDPVARRLITKQGVKGRYYPASRTITFDGVSEETLMHEITHHYQIQVLGDSSEELPEDMEWLIQHSTIGPVQWQIERAFLVFYSPIVEFFRFFLEPLNPNGAFEKTELEQYYEDSMVIEWYAKEKGDTSRVIPAPKYDDSPLGWLMGKSTPLEYPEQNLGDVINDFLQILEIPGITFHLLTFGIFANEGGQSHAN